MLFFSSDNSLIGITGFFTTVLTASVLFQGLVSVGAIPSVEELQKKQDVYYTNRPIISTPVYNQNNNYINPETHRHHFTKTVTETCTSTKYIEKTKTVLINNCSNGPRYYKKRNYGVAPINGNVYNASPNNIVINDNKHEGQYRDDRHRVEDVHHRNGENSEHHRVGGHCRKGSYVCVGVDNPTFLQCDHGKFIKKTCGPGTVCRRNKGNSIYCGYPSHFRKH
ncbi:hypothetical protein AYI68_g4700 [Smittium mucronatum]|uniref:Carbohydrate-binding module family 19 domain-containing protein n=1 Tax=Smittium mucronatum TaxID=133383 RepID=A0A1R0GWI2_9FUNG|nr:hypothetical protein AYI68_g4700 [Smittium mucronatum]